MIIIHNMIYIYNYDSNSKQNIILDTTNNNYVKKLYVFNVFNVYVN